MSTCMNTIRDSYSRNFPAQVPIKAAQGFIATALISLVSGSTASVALLGGAIAATATLIEAVTRPIIKAIFPEHDLIVILIQIFLPRATALEAAAALSPWIGVTYKMKSALIPIFAWIYLNNNIFERNVAMVELL